MNGQYIKRIIADKLKVGFITLKSFINNCFQKNNIKRIPFVICLVTVFCISAINLNFAYAVSYDGQIICYAKDWSELQTVIDKVEKTASDALGYEFSLDSDLTAKLSLGAEKTISFDELEQLLLSSIPEVKYLYAVCVDGKTVCAFEDIAEAEAALSELVNAYINEKTISVEYEDEITIEQKYVRSDLLADRNTALKFLKSNINVATQEIRTVEEAVVYDIECIDDDSMVVGKTITQSEGVNGRALAEYKTTCLNGAIQSTETEKYTVIKEPVPAVVIKGTREKVSEGQYIWPCTGEITSAFGYRSVSIGSSNHKGIDIADDYGTAIYATDGGIVTKAEYYCGYGKMIIIEHDNGDQTYYAHLSSIDVEVGDIVRQGDYIGAMGCTGTASGTHLHFEYHPGGGAAVDPTVILP